MLPTRLNLLPPEKKILLKHVVYFQFVKDLLGLSLFLLCVSSIALVGGVWVLQEHFNELTRKTILFNSRYEETNKKMMALNEVITRVGKIQQDYVLWTPILAEFTTAVPDNIYLKTLNLNMDKKQVSFTGVAPTREDLLILQKTIDEHSLIGKADIPLSSLTDKENVPFSITTPINR